MCIYIYIDSTITSMELGPQSHGKDGLAGPNSINGPVHEPVDVAIGACLCLTS